MTVDLRTRQRGSDLRGKIPSVGAKITRLEKGWKSIRQCVR